MRVALLSADWRRNGGVASYLRRLAVELTAGGDAVHVVHGDAGEPLDGVGSTRVPGCTRHDISRTRREEAAARAIEALDRFRPDVVHVHDSHNFVLEARVRDRYRAIKTLHVHDFCPSNTKYHHAIERACVYPTGPMCLPRMGYLACTTSRRPTVWLRQYRRTETANRNNLQYSKIVVASDFVRRQALASAYDPARVDVVPYFVNPVPSSEPEPRLILTGGRLVREKGVDLLLAALAQVPRPWRAIVAGDGHDSLKLRALAARYGVSADVEFAGWQDEAGMSALFRRASMVVVPSRWPEPSGIIGLEAMTHARPVVAFETGGIPEWLVHGDTGLLVPPNDVPALAASISALLDDPPAARRMGEAGRTRVTAAFSAPLHLAQLRALYTALPTP